VVIALSLFSVLLSTQREIMYTFILAETGVSTSINDVQSFLVSVQALGLEGLYNEKGDVVVFNKGEVVGTLYL